MQATLTAFSETSAYKFQWPGNYPEESIQHAEQGEILKSRKHILFIDFKFIILNLKILKVVMILCKPFVIP